MKKNRDIQLDNGDIVIGDGDLCTINNMNAIAQIINSRIITIPSRFIEWFNEYILNKFKYIGKANTRELGVQMEEYISNVLYDIQVEHPNIIIEISVLPYDEYTLYIKIFITDTKTETYTTNSYIYSIKDGVLDVYLS